MSLHADLSRLAAEDDFKKNLSFFWQFESVADVEIVVRIEEEFEISITDYEAERTQTVEELVNLVWQKVRQRAAQQSLAADGAIACFSSNLFPSA
jgi:acyl carrier protein